MGHENKKLVELGELVYVNVMCLGCLSLLLGAFRSLLLYF